MKIFYKKLRREHLEQFDKDLAKILESEFPLYKETLTISKFDGIGFPKKQNSIAISRSFDSKTHKKTKDKFNRNFDLNGVLLWHRKTKKYTPVKLRFHFEALSQILIENPTNFREEFNLKKILIEKLSMTEIENIA